MIETTQLLQSMDRMPPGIAQGAIPLAELSSSLTSEELVGNHEADAFFFRSLEASNIRLNKAQVEAVRACDGSVLINAGAGSGKTTVLTCRTAYLMLVRKVPPQNIVLVTFTRQAAGQMKDRLKSIPGITPGMVNKIIIGTFHSLARTIYFHKLTNKPRIMSEKQKEFLVGQITRELAVGEQYESETLLALFAHIKNGMYWRNRELNEQAQELVKQDVRDVFRSYESYKLENELLDFEDLITGCIDVLEQHQSYLQSLRKRMEYIMVDEYQDTNYAQYEMIRLLAEESNLCVVGDPDQAIYGWRGADPSIILKFPEVYPDCSRVTLDINYRSPGGVVGLGNEIIRHNTRRFDKKLKVTQRDSSMPMYWQPKSVEREADDVLQLIQQLVKADGYRYHDIAVLYRTHSTARTLYERLLMSGLPFTTHRDEPTFYELSTIRPVLDFLRLSLDPYNEKALEGVLPCLYISKAKFMKELQILSIQRGISYIDALGELDLPAYQKRRLREERVPWIKSISRVTPLQAVKEIRNEPGGGYDKFLGSQEDGAVTYHKEIMRDDLSELEDAVKGFQTVPEFLSYVDRVIRERESRKQQKDTDTRQGITLQTIHSAKGLEYPVVILIGMIDGVLPHSIAVSPEDKPDIWLQAKEGELLLEAMEEERRLAYVAVTRAKKMLYISTPAYFRGKPSAVSPFIKEAFQAGKSAIAGTSR
ncbi:UvrD-helicase domain-containing protein [Aneurinibacillus sp. Ricciae_BoGa-3]|uniref:ATP-dependent helicase n=1 Tax=Aneurinibacillus sp. Ricciae_BoGa-3 TaxID=3022697 RepID=UPI0023419DCA|nr:UvrD-helicase domain-containing protein [Aneurinibacillus sp. Ricciae_BoGa-3]WCK52785.1 UvrD-helicase domain-containing protein [Aneurinibacillus sp. Ricciae_BoGa-3]